MSEVDRQVTTIKKLTSLTPVYNLFSQLSGEVLVIFVAPATLHREEFAGGGRECQQHRWYHSPMAWKSSR